MNEDNVQMHGCSSSLQLCSFMTVYQKQQQNVQQHVTQLSSHTDSCEWVVKEEKEWERSKIQKV